MLLKETRKQAREVFNTLNTVPHGRLDSAGFANLKYLHISFKISVSTKIYLNRS